MSESVNTLQNYVSDMLALERHILDAVKRQVDDDATNRHPQAIRLVSKIHGVLASHVSETEQHLSNLGGHPTSGVKEAVASVAGIAAGLIDKVRTNTVSKMLRDDYSALSLAAIGHTMLHTTGLALKSSLTADLALRHLYDITPLIVEISEIIPLVVTVELTDDGEVVDTAVGPEALHNTQKAWKNEVVR